VRWQIYPYRKQQGIRLRDGCIYVQAFDHQLVEQYVPVRNPVSEQDSAIVGTVASSSTKSAISVPKEMRTEFSVITAVRLQSSEP